MNRSLGGIFLAANSYIINVNNLQMWYKEEDTSYVNCKANNQWSILIYITILRQKVYLSQEE